jgi:HEAT repeat protein
MKDLSGILDDLFSGDDERAEAAAQQIGQHGQAAVNPLLAILETRNADHRWWAVRALSHFDQAEAEEALCRALTDGDESVRQCAALSLRERPAPAAVPALIQILEDRDRLLARLAGDALAAIGNPAVNALIDAMQSSSSGVRIEAARALAKIENVQAAACLFNALDDPSPWVNYWAEAGLRKLGMEMVFFKT